MTKILSDISIWSILLPLGIGAAFLRRLSRDSILILAIVVLGAIPQLLRAFTDDSRLLTPTYNGYTLCEFVLLFFLFRPKMQKRKTWFYAIAATYVLISGALVGMLGFMSRFLNEWVVANNLVYTAWILLVIIEEYESGMERGFDYEAPFLWYLTGLFFYCPCTLLIFSLWNYIRHHPESNLQLLWTIHSIFNTALYLLFAMGMIKNIRSRHHSHQLVDKL